MTCDWKVKVRDKEREERKGKKKQSQTINSLLYSGFNSGGRARGEFQ